MANLIRYTYKVCAITTLGTLALATGRNDAPAGFSAADLPRVESEAQLDHALELFNRSGFVYLLNDGTDLRPYILEAVAAALPPRFETRAFDIARAVIVEANHHGMDPMFLLAVIKTESKFDLEARGSHGEIGLMQVLPSTAAWIAPQAGIPAQFDLTDPAINIRIGATYFAQLRRSFGGRTPRYVGAYNMGSLNVRRLLASNIEPREYPSKVLGNYKDLYRSLSHSVVTAAAAGRVVASVNQ